MSKSFYSVNDLLTNNPIYNQKLKTDVLQQFFEQHVSCNAYIYELSNNSTINLLFDKNQFCHLIGLHYFGYEKTKGWHDLLNDPKEILSFRRHDKFNLIQYRIQNFNKILSLLNSPNIYIYETAKHPQFRYKSDYFAVLYESKRAFKLGIAISQNNIHYAETFMADMDTPQYNFYLNPNNLLSIINKKIIDKGLFLKTFGQM